MDLFMEEGVDEIKVSWGVSHLDTVELEVTPTFTQVHFDQCPVKHCDSKIPFLPRFQFPGTHTHTHTYRHQKA